MNWHSWGWVGIVVLFLVWEAIGLLSPIDTKQPFTYFVRKVAMVEPLWFLLAGFLAWLPYHFLFRRK